MGRGALEHLGQQNNFDDFTKNIESCKIELVHQKIWAKMVKKVDDIFAILPSPSEEI